MWTFPITVKQMWTIPTTVKQMWLIPNYSTSNTNTQENDVFIYILVVICLNLLLPWALMIYFSQKKTLQRTCTLVDSKILHECAFRWTFFRWYLILWFHWLYINDNLSLMNNNISQYMYMIDETLLNIMKSSNAA